MYQLFSQGLGLILAAMLVVPPTNAAPVEPPGGNRPVTKNRLIGAKLKHHRSEPYLLWTFQAKTFRLEVGDKAPPMKLIETLTGGKKPVSRIEGNWELDEKKGLLVLSKIKADGKDVRREARLKIAGAGAVRANLGDHQYNIFPRGFANNTQEPAAGKSKQ
jgi:hypothetical protein